MVTVKEETRKGPWTEQEDLQLVCCVGLLGDRRWDFIAKVSGLNRTGKSCRLRWVNYLHPGLKRGRMTPQEERLILDLHSRWGNRWSRIARRLPGRTDNEIKNYWRTHMRKKAQERKSNSSPGPSSSSSCSCLHGDPLQVAAAIAADKAEQQGAGGGSTRGSSSVNSREEEEEEVVNGYPMEQIWDEIAPSELSGFACYAEQYQDVTCDLSCLVMPSPPWGYYSCVDPLWKIDDEEFRMLNPAGDLSLSHCERAREP